MSLPVRSPHPIWQVARFKLAVRSCKWQKRGVVVVVCVKTKGRTYGAELFNDDDYCYIVPLLYYETTSHDHDDEYDDLHHRLLVPSVVVVAFARMPNPHSIRPSALASRCRLQGSAVHGGPSGRPATSARFLLLGSCLGTRPTATLVL